MSTSFAVWVSAFFTLAVFSLVFYKENPVYRFVEHAFLGISVGHTLVFNVKYVMDNGFTPLFKGTWAVLIPIILGLLLFTRYWKGYTWVAKIPMAVIIAVGAGLGMRGAISAQVIDQLKATFVAPNSLNNIVIIVGVFASLAYFFFTTTFTDKLGKPMIAVSRLGRIVLMVAFGASFSNSTMNFLSQLINRMNFLLGTWLGIVK